MGEGRGDREKERGREISPLSRPPNLGFDGSVDFFKVTNLEWLWSQIKARRYICCFFIIIILNFDKTHDLCIVCVPNTLLCSTVHFHFPPCYHMTLSCHHETSSAHTSLSHQVIRTPKLLWHMVPHGLQPLLAHWRAERTSLSPRFTSVLYIN